MTDQPKSAAPDREPNELSEAGPNAAGPNAAEPNAAIESTAAPDAARRGWPFWRKRAARAVLVGGVLFVVMKFAPVVPREQSIDVRAPERERIVELEVTIRDTSGAPQSSARLHPVRPEQRLRHSVELPSGTYVLDLQAVLEAPAPDGTKTSRAVEVSREVRLEEHTVRVDLTP